MRFRAALFVALVLVACEKPPADRSRSEATTSARTPAAEARDSSTGPLVEFLLRSAASDFRAHRPPYPARVRDVRVGHVLNPQGARQYVLCGELLSAKDSTGAGWTPFATIRTSGYEQYLGAQAESFCRGPSFTRDAEGDLTASLQSRLDSLR